MGRTLNRVAGVVFAGALATFAATPAALAQTETGTSPTDTTTSTATTASTSESPTTTSSPTSTTAPSSTSVTPPATSSPSTTGDVKTTEKRVAPKAEPDKPVEEAPKDDYQDNIGHGFVGLGGEGVLVIACAAGAPGNLATQYLSVTGGPDQDESDGRYWNYSVRVVDAPAGTTTAKFSWTCSGVEGNGIAEFEQEEPPTSTTTTTTATSVPPSSTAPVTTATSSTPAGNAAPKAQVKVAPKGGVETGFGGTAR